MAPSTLVAFTAYVVLGVVGLVLLRANVASAVAHVRAGDLLARPVLLGVAGGAAYASSFATWLVVLARVPLSTAYPLAVGATLALSTVVARLVLDEQMSVRLVTGIVTIFVGVVLVSTA